MRNQQVQLGWLIMCFLLLSGLTGPGQINAQQLLNLDFEKESAEGLTRPWGWQVYFHTPSVTFSCDTTEVFSGNHSLRIQGEVEVDEDRFKLTFSVEPNQLLNQEIGIRFQAKTEAFSGEAGILIETIGRVEDGFGTLSEKEIPVTSREGWHQYQLTDFALGDQLHTLNITLYFRGIGTAWFDQLELLLDQEVQTSVPVAPPFSEAETRELFERITTFNTVEPTIGPDLKEADFSDLASFKSIVGDAQIIALGESTHGTSEFFQVKHRLLQYAVRELGVRVFVLEDNQLAVEKINDFVRYGTGEAAAVIKGLFAVWNTHEMLNLIKWVRSYNEAHPAAMVEFVGIDVQNPSLALEALSTFLKEKDPLLQVKADSLLADFSEEWRNSYFKSEANLTAWEQQTSAVYQILESKKETWLKSAETKADSNAIVWAVQHARVLQQCVASMLTGAFEGRDQAMADNVEWIRNQRPAGTRMLIWAHDTHVNRGEAEIPEHNYYFGASMGAILAKRHGANYRAFGLYTYSGTCLGTISYRNFKRIPFTLYTSPTGSLDHALHQAAQTLNQPYLILNLKSTENQAWLDRLLPVRYVGYVAEDYGFNGRYLIPKQFDGIIFIDQTKAAQPLKK